MNKDSVTFAGTFSPTFKHSYEIVTILLSTWVILGQHGVWHLCDPWLIPANLRSQLWTDYWVIFLLMPL